MTKYVSAKGFRQRFPGVVEDLKRSIKLRSNFMT